ncbi:succinyl-diaminopimelate desuccinylase [Gryllotalpicola koreensis]|uniref:Succinyl-diaminopimelate desuccinylase n=1 Tax=Gryllotalpicola koreensis TaxID=993086 RepID=A0ABP8A877_9MICO
MPLDLAATSIELTRQICDIESVSGNEKAVADEIEQALERMPHLEVLRDGDLVVARTHLGRARRVVIAGHIDTVPVNGNLPTRFEAEGGVEYLWGRGTVDMKPGVAVALKLAAELSSPSVDVTWLFYDHEEVTSDLNGLARLARTRPELLAGDFAILGEPSNGAVEGGCNGTMRFDVVTRGKRAHSARGWMGENAIHKAAPILALLADFEPETIEVDGLAYREQLNAVLVSGGVAGNVIPDECRIHINYRFAPSRSGAEAEAKMRALFEPLGEFVLQDLAPGARPGLDDPLAQEFLAAVGLEAKPKYGWTDVARFSALGIPAVNFGPGDPSLAHADGERVPLAQITACEDALRAWLS